jgi:hypothetical protein
MNTLKAIEPDCRVEVWNLSISSFSLCEMYFNKSTQKFLLLWPVVAGGVDELRTIELTEAEMSQGQFNHETKRLQLRDVVIENDSFVVKRPESNHGLN